LVILHVEHEGISWLEFLMCIYHIGRLLQSQFQKYGKAINLILTEMLLYWALQFLSQQRQTRGAGPKEMMC
jgi:hypothetical protein